MKVNQVAVLAISSMMGWSQLASAETSVNGAATPPTVAVASKVSPEQPTSQVQDPQVQLDANTIAALSDAAIAPLSPASFVPTESVNDQSSQPVTDTTHSTNRTRLQLAANLTDLPQPRSVAETESFADLSNLGVDVSHRNALQQPETLSTTELNFEIASSPKQARSLFNQIVQSPFAPQGIHSLQDIRPSDANFILADGEESATDNRQWTSARPDGHAPIGVMGDHTHGAGEVMLSYRYSYMDMDGNRDGTQSLSTRDVLRQFPVTPTRMTMQMHMLGAMYAPTDELTLMAMAPYVVKEMDHITRRGVRFTTDSEGFGDIKLSALYKVIQRNRQRLHLNFGVGFPTGSIDKKDRTPAGPDQQLPYPMQIGAGTFSLLPGITYLGQTDNWSWGAQALGTIYLGENSRNYRLGNRLNLTGWVARRLNRWTSLSFRLDGKTWGNISGADDDLNPNLIPTADPDRRGGTQLDLVFGFNFYVPKGDLSGVRAALEFALPVHRSLDGPQLETDWQITFGLQGVL